MITEESTESRQVYAAVGVVSRTGGAIQRIAGLAGETAYLGLKTVQWALRWESLKPIQAGLDGLVKRSEREVESPIDEGRREADRGQQTALRLIENGFATAAGASAECLEIKRVIQGQIGLSRFPWWLLRYSGTSA
jgi:hypothetical protein